MSHLALDAGRKIPFRLAIDDWSIGLVRFAEFWLNELGGLGKFLCRNFSEGVIFGSVGLFLIHFSTVFEPVEYPGSCKFKPLIPRWAISSDPEEFEEIPELTTLSKLGIFVLPEELEREFSGNLGAKFWLRVGFGGWSRKVFFFRSRFSQSGDKRS